MELMNDMYKARDAGAVGSAEWAETQDIYLRMLAPLAPHIAEELWTNQLNKPYSIHQQDCPTRWVCPPASMLAAPQSEHRLTDTW